MTRLGVPQGRVLLLRADLSDGASVSVGSGTLIASRLVLTAAHLVFDKMSGSPLDGVVAGPAGSRRLSQARVVWPRNYRPTDDPAALDVALVEITEPDWQPSAAGSVRWGRLTGRSSGVVCEATGFPRVLRDPNHVRESDQISGTINPGTGSVTGRHDITVTSATPATGKGSFPSPWSGASGAGVFAAGLLTAVLVIDTKWFDHRRLTAIPCYRILAEPEVRRILQTLGISCEVESVELSQLLISAGLESSMRRRQGQQSSPSMLLRADFEAVDFYGRTDQLMDLTDWCADPDIEVGLRLVIGPGGRGKTRLARKLVADFRGREWLGNDAGRSWVAGFLTDRIVGRPLARLADTAAPVLAIVDYAETRKEQLAELLPLLWAADSAPPVRLLLLARGAGDWWEQLERDLGVTFGPPTVLPTLDKTINERRHAFRSAVTGLARRLPFVFTGNDTDWVRRGQELPLPEDLRNARFGDPLSLQLIALLSLLDQPTSVNADEAAVRRWSDDPEQYLLTQHEKKYWLATADGRLNLEIDTLAEGVTAATLVGAASRSEALALLRHLPALRGQTEDTIVAMANWLRDLYPGSPGNEWGGLQPDRVGEHLIAQTLTGNKKVLTEILAAASDTQNFQAVAVLGRTLANLTILDSSRRQLAGQLSDLLGSSEAGSRVAQVLVQGDLAARAKQQPPAIDHTRLAAAMDRFVGLSAAQFAAVEMIATNWTAVLRGAPGTGKVTTVARALAVLVDQIGPPPRVALAASTEAGAANMRETFLRQVSGVDPRDRQLGNSTPTASTLHRLLGALPGRDTRPRYNRTNRLPFDVVVVDETPILSLKWMAWLLEALRLDARLVLVGDPNQLVFDQTDAVLVDLAAGLSGWLDRETIDRGQSSVMSRTAELDPDWRPPVMVLGPTWRPSAGLGELTASVRDGDAERAINVLFTEGNDDVSVSEKGLREDVVDAVASMRAAALAGDAQSALVRLGRHRLLCAGMNGRYGVDLWNRRIEGWLSEIDEYREEGSWYFGRPLLVTANDQIHGLARGDTGVLIRDTDGSANVVFARGSSIIRLAISQLPAVRPVHATTVSSSQGRQFARVSLVLPAEDSPLLNREILYVGLTRASSFFRLVGTPGQVRAAIERLPRRHKE